VSRKILLGVVSNLPAPFRQILEGCELDFVQPLPEAQAPLRSDKHNMIVADVLFDESRMFELLRLVRTEVKYRTTPIVCLRSHARVRRLSM
jgi:hypothetical protein